MNSLAQGSIDLIEEFAAILPLRIILEILGVPVASQHVGGVPQDFYAYLLALIENKRTMPDDALISRLIRAEAESKQISAREVVTMTFLLITAGHDTADNLIGNGMLALLTHPELIKTAVEELLR